MPTIKKLETRIQEIKTELQKIDEFRIGSLSKQWNVCGNPNCRCKDKGSPKKHGPYNKLSYTWNGKSKTEFIKEENIAEVKGQIEVYKQFRQLTNEWIDLCLELANLRKKQLKEKSKRD